jgi:hypothetical protein
MLVASRRRAHRGFSRTIVRGGSFLMDPGDTAHPARTSCTTTHAPRSFPARSRVSQSRFLDRHGGSDIGVGVGATRASGGDPTRFHDVVAARRGEGESHVLFDQQD